MRRTIQIVACFLALTMWRPATASEPAGRLVETEIAAPSLHGNLFAIPDRQPIAIYLPPSYDGGTGRYPVVYFLPGFGDPLAYYTRYGVYQGFQLRESLDALIQAGRIGEMIVVIPNTATFLGGTFCVDSPLLGDWESFIARDVVDYVDAGFRTEASADRRGIAGFSAGGFSALHLAMRHPDRFGAVYALSPGLFDPQGLGQNVMFASPATVRGYLVEQSHWAGLAEPEAALSFVAWATHRVYAAADFYCGFTYAYGAAFAADMSRPFPHIAYPFEARGDSLVRDDAAWGRFDSGFGDLAVKVQRHRDNLARLKAIGFEVGTADEYEWLPRGCAELSRLLADAGIRHDFRTFAGDHQGMLRQRMEEQMLPFFWGLFGAAPGSGRAR